MSFETNEADLAVGPAALTRDGRLPKTTEATTLHYQPVIAMRDGGLRGFETVLRWPNGPGHATEHGAVASARLLAQACVEVRYWPGCRIAVNLSVPELAADGLLDQVDAALAMSGLAPWLLELEFSESSRFQSLAMVRGLRARGVGVVLDDFGVGGASLKLLRRLPWTAVKLDRGLVRDLPTDTEACSTARALLDAAQALGMRSMADGLETLAQRDLLIRLGCDEAQGPLYSRPIAPERLAALLDYGVDTCPEPRSGSETRDDRAVPH